MIQVQAIDHVVLVTSDVERAVRWYAEHLGLVPERLEQWRRGEVLFASLRISPQSIIDVFAGERTGINVDHLSFAVDPTVDLRALAASGEFDIDHEPFVIWGARGDGLAMYVRDPDGNRIELKQYT
jgi:catechol 2,3-dioxygenase-like lactoylglutathione lyase family enzyme